MLVITPKAGSGTRHSGEGIFDFGKILLKKALSSNLLKKATKAINSDLGQAVISTAKKAAESDLGQELKKQAVSAVKRKALDVLESTSVPTSVKKAAKTEVGQILQKKIVSEIGKRSRDLGDATGTAFQKLGIAEPPRKKVKRKRKRKGRGLVYPQDLIDQFVGSGIILE